MEWKRATLIKTDKVTDALGNAVPAGRRIVLETRARIIPWSYEQIRLTGYDRIRSTTQAVLPIPFRELPDFDLVRIDGKDFSYTEIQPMNRFSMVYLKGYGRHEHPSTY